MDGGEKAGEKDGEKAGEKGKRGSDGPATYT